MSDCECPICYEAITPETGLAKLSCGHSYHIFCISNWFCRQEGNSSCAMCRKEMGPLEDMPEQESESESEYSDSDESRNTEQAAEDERNAHYAAKARKHYAGLGDDAPAAAAKKIQSIIRMFLVRSSYLNVVTSLWIVKTFEKNLVTHKQHLRMDIAKLHVGRVAWRIASATLIQALWRGFRARETVKDMKIKNCVGIKKFQALWRGYHQRKSIESCWVTFTQDGDRLVTM